jgi:uncharacterized protein YbjT (DUF2867 family)
MKVAVFGATGTIGAPLLPLLAREHEVVAISRRPHEGEAAIEWRQADASDATSIRRALDSVDVAYYLVHSLGMSDFEERDLRAASTIAEEAERAELRQLIYLGGLGENEDDLSPHLRSRIETGRRLDAMVIGPGSAAFETVVALVDRLPAMVCPRWVGVPTQPIALDDALAYFTGVCGLEQAFDRSFDIGGPEVMTYREMIERIARLREKHPLIVEVPLLTPRLSSYWLHLVTPVKAAVARPLIEGLRSETVVRENGIDQLVPLELMPFDEAARDPLSYSSSSRS